MSKSKKSRKNKTHGQVTDSPPSPQNSGLKNPFLTSSGHNQETRKSTSTLFNTAETGHKVDSRLVSDIRKIASSPVSKAATVEAKESPSYKASQRAKSRQQPNSQSIPSSPPLSKSNLADYDHLDEIMDVGNDNQERKKQVKAASRLNGLNMKSINSAVGKGESRSGSDSGDESDTTASSSSSSENEVSDTVTLPAAIRAPASSCSTKPDATTHSPSPARPALKRRLSPSSASSSASSSDGESAESSDSDSDTSTTRPQAKRLKPNPAAETKPSTVAGRNPLPPELLNGTIKPRPTSHSLDMTTYTSPDDTKPTVHTNIKYPNSVLSAARSLEALLPAYLTSANISDQGRRIDHQPLRPAAGSDDTTRVETLLISARKLIFHLSVKRLSETDADIQGQLLKVANRREADLKTMEGEVKTLLTKIQEGGSRRRRN